MSVGLATAALLSDTLSAPASSSRAASSADAMPPPTVKGMSIRAAMRDTSPVKVRRPSSEALMSRYTSSSAPSAAYFAPSSTGSPTCRSAVKLIPLTVWPSRMSRQGIMRLASMVRVFRG